MRERGEILTSEHVFVAGRTGSGKTYLARKYLAGFPYVVALDSKGTLHWPEIPEKNLALVTELEALPRLPAEKTHIIYRPRWEEMDFDHYDAFFQWCYLRGNTQVWIDELMAVCPSPMKIPPYLKAIYTRGRELNVSAWGLTQRPTGIPVLTMSEASHFFIFDLNMPQDREKLVEVTGHQEFYEQPGKYTFWYYFVENDRPIKARLVEKTA